MSRRDESSRFRNAGNPKRCWRPESSDTVRRWCCSPCSSRSRRVSARRGTSARCRATASRSGTTTGGARTIADIDVSFGYTRIYGGLVEFLSVAAQHVIPADIYVVRHAREQRVRMDRRRLRVSDRPAPVRDARRVAGGSPARVHAAVHRRLDEQHQGSAVRGPDARRVLLHRHDSAADIRICRGGTRSQLAIAIALALNVRSMGLVLLGYTGVALALAVIASRDFSPRRLAATAGRFAVIVLVALVAGTAFWPWAQQQPLVRPLQAFFMASGFSWGNPSLFAGRYIPSAELPWYYLPTWLGHHAAAGRHPRRIRLESCACGVVKIRGSRASDWRPSGRSSWCPPRMRSRPASDAVRRHSAHVLHRPAHRGARGGRVGPDAGRPAAPGGACGRGRLVVGLAEPLWFQIRNHPNQTVYFTPFIGGPRGAFGRFDMDYWGNCVLQAVKWSADQAERARMPVVVTANAWEIAVVDIMRFRPLAFRLQRHGGSHLDIRLLKGRPRDVLGTNGDPGIVHRVTTADDTPLCVVLQGPEYPQLAERACSRGVGGGRRPGDAVSKDLQARTIADFGEQWTSYPDSEGFFGSAELFDDFFRPLVSAEDLAEAPCSPRSAQAPGGSSTSLRRRARRTLSRWNRRRRSACSARRRAGSRIGSPI